AGQGLAAGGGALDQGAHALFTSEKFAPAGWQEWLEGRLLYREATTLIEGTPPPDDPRLRVVRARALAALDLEEQAAAELSRATQQDVKGATAWLIRGYAYAKVGRWDQAAADHARALELEPPRDPRAWRRPSC